MRQKTAESLINKGKTRVFLFIKKYLKIEAEAILEPL